MREGERLAKEEKEGCTAACEGERLEREKKRKVHGGLQKGKVSSKGN